MLCGQMHSGLWMHWRWHSLSETHILSFKGLSSLTGLSKFSGLGLTCSKNYMRASSVEIATPSGQTLRRFTLDECGGGPHEFRGVLRSSLLEALEAAAPKDCIAYNTPIASIEDGGEGDVSSPVPIHRGSKHLLACSKILQSTVQSS